LPVLGHAAFLDDRAFAFAQQIFGKGLGLDCSFRSKAAAVQVAHNGLEHPDGFGISLIQAREIEGADKQAPFADPQFEEVGEFPHGIGRLQFR